MTRFVFLILAGLLLFGFPTPTSAQDTPDPALYQAMKWRNIGPFRGGRGTAVSGVPGKPFTFFMGTAGGGLWQTEDAGNTWKNVSDGFFKTGSVGAVAVAPNDANVIYVGMGEAAIRGVTTSHGDGVYKSTDGGATWTHIGLDKTRQISKIQIHPQNADVVYVAAQGNQWADEPDRGIYRSTDGGATWEHVLFVDEGTGASDLSMDPTNPRMLYAGFWDHQRKPWQVISGGEGSGIYKSTDGGDTWNALKTGLPDMMGKIGVAVSPANPQRVWAIIEADEGGLFRSDNGGKTWTRLNEDRLLRARSWYYTHITAHPQNEETVFVMNAPFTKSIDGGKTFTVMPTPHGDNHCLWINPDQPEIMINCNDGGANVSLNGGATWSTQVNQPTAQFYRVITDNRFPYYVYGGQQDNSTVAIASRTTDGGIGREDWYPVGGCESAYAAFNPDDPRYVYAGCYQGIISEFDLHTRTTRSVMAYPFLGLGSDAKDNKYRFNWNAPIVVSPHDPNTIYHAGNVLLKTTDRGKTWTEISPDLTRNDLEKQGNGGAPITNEAAGAETYNTIFYIVESPHEAGTIWAGTDDGFVHLTRNGGENWANVTPAGLGEAQVNAIEVSPHDPGTAYLAVTNYKFGDYTPHVFKTTNYGQQWIRLVEGIEEEAWVRVVREDPGRRDLLYAGTEKGLYISFNGGQQWQPFQLNLPVVSITDLALRNNDLVAATQGRAFWILDDLTPLHQLHENVADADFHLFEPRPAYWMAGGSGTAPNMGQNPPNGVVLHYILKEAPDEEMPIKLEISDAQGHVLRTMSSDANPQEGGVKIGAKAGMNQTVWNYTAGTVTRVPDLFVFGNLNGYRVPPGSYTATLHVGDDQMSQPVEIRSDPRLDISAPDFNEQQTLLADLLTSLDDMHRSVNDLRAVQKQIRSLMDLVDGRDGGAAITEAGEAFIEQIEAWEENIVQAKQKTFQDVINFPNKLNAHFAHMISELDGAAPGVNAGARQRTMDLQAQWAAHRATRDQLLGDALADFNALVQQHAMPAILPPAPKSSTGRPPIGGSGGTKSQR